MKARLALLILFLALVQLSGQTFSLEGKVMDATGRHPLPGAHVSLLRSISSQPEGQITDDAGHFRFVELAPGAYDLKITFIGYQDLLRKVTIADRDVSLGMLTLTEGSVELKQVEISGAPIPIIQKGDTTEFDARSYQTLPDASAEELVGKMPTVVVENGKVQAQGEDVKQVLVDGRPFLGNDPTAALRNLPAEIIDKIQIFDQQSDQAQFTGFDDGETQKTINIITRADRRSGQFGKLYAGYGYEDKYSAGGNVSLFNGDQRISLIGMSNNVNQQNFASEDLLGVVGSNNRRGGGSRGRGGGRGGRGGGGQGGNFTGSSSSDFLVPQQGGITTTHALGLNYADLWGEKLEVSGSYFFNLTDNSASQFLNRKFVTETSFSESYTEESSTDSKNANHRLNALLEYKIDSLNSLIFRPRLSWQFNDGQSNTLGQSFFDTTLQSSSLNAFQSDLSGVNFSGNLLYRHRFHTPRRTLSVNVSSAYAPKRGESRLLSQNSYFGDAPSVDTLNQQATLDLNSWNLATNLAFTEPAGKNGMLMFNYRISYQQEASDKLTYDWNEGSQDYDELNESLSNIFSNDYITHQPGLGYNYRKGQLVLMGRVSLQWADLNNEQTYPESGQLDRNFFNILPMAMLRLNVSRLENLRINYRTNTRLPSIEQLQNVVDNSNPLFLKVGNPRLIPAYQHSFFARYTKANTEKSSIFFALLGANYTANQISTSTFLPGYDHPIFEAVGAGPGTQVSLPVNLDGHWNLRSMLTYGFPVAPIKSNLNVDLTANYSRSPGLVNETLGYTNTTTLGLGLTLSSNISQKLDFNLSVRPGYSFINNTLQPQDDANYLSMNSRLKFNWIFGGGFIFRNELTHQFYDGLSADLDQNFWLWNMSIGKQFFKDQRGEISLGVFDLLNQNTSIVRNVTETFVEDVQTNVLQQYFMLTFTYNLRNFQIK